MKFRNFLSLSIVTLFTGLAVQAQDDLSRPATGNVGTPVTSGNVSVSAPTGIKCCGKLLIRKPGSKSNAAPVVLATAVLAGKNAAGIDLTFDMLDPYGRTIDRKLWRVEKYESGDIFFDASKVGRPAAGKKYKLRVRYGTKFMDYSVQ
ncbi:MAG: hypothetical protein WAS56_15390 [Saprospiraceae bacterium]|jgi:hypothetical protein|nr:hypothetical protein [Saprospiraceae bacterium]MBK9994673.1 hypothetical protein [Saprospiraceae bacterium]